MKVAELRAREDFEKVFHRTLERAWHIQLGRQQQVTAPGRGGQVWFQAWPVDVHHTQRPAMPVRRFMRRLFQFSPRIWRTPIHFTVAHLASFQVGLGILGRPGFSADPPIPDSEWKAVLAGNQRVRIFDFQTGRILVVAKDGLLDAGMEQEVAFRASADRPEFVPGILGFDLEDGWFEEPLLEDFVPLPRLAPWFFPGKIGKAALRRVEDWSARLGWQTWQAEDWIDRILERIRSQDAWSSSQAAARMEGPLAELARTAAILGKIQVGWSHGDFQPGNVLGHVRGGDFRVIDWEHRAERYVFYDRVVYETALRWGGDLRARFHAFLRGQGGGDRVLPRERAARRSVLALVVLEDILWRMEQAGRGGFEPEWAAMDRVIEAWV